MCHVEVVCRKKEVLSWKPDYTCRIVISVVTLNCDTQVITGFSVFNSLKHTYGMCTHIAETHMRMHAHTPSLLGTNQLKAFITASRHSCLSDASTGFSG